MGVALTTGVLGVSGKQMVYDRAKQASELEGYAQQAEHEGNREAASCFRQAKTDKYAEAAIDIASLSAGLLNIKQAHLKPIKEAAKKKRELDERVAKFNEWIESMDINRYIKSAPEDFVANPNGLVGDLNLITPEQFKSIPEKTVLYNKEGKSFVKELIQLI